MRIAGITWWRGNYGSVLQAYALARTINSLPGMTYEVLDQFGSVRSVRGLLERARDKRPSQLIKKLRWNYLMPQLKERRAALDAFVEQRLPVSAVSYGMSTIEDANESYDGFVCGSDQIWNPNLIPPGVLYWLLFAHDDKLRIAYAPSIGVRTLTPEQQSFMRRAASRLDALSCREETGARLIQETTHIPCAHVADPTLLLDATTWKELADAEAVEEPIDRPYAFAYLLRSTNEARRAIEAYCRHEGLRVVCFPYLDPEHVATYDRDFGDVRLFDAGPADFVSLIRKASCVFCDSYHASIFSILTHTDFYLFPKVGEERSDRVDDLLHTLGIASREVDATDLAARIRAVPAIDWRRVDERLESFRTFSLAYLTNALGAR